MDWLSYYKDKETNVAHVDDIYNLISEVLFETTFEGLGSPSPIEEEDLRILDEVADAFGSPQDLLIEMSDKMRREEAESFLVSLPKYQPNEAWGDPDAVDRKTVNRIFTTIGGGASVEGKLKFLQRITHPHNRITSPRRVLASLLVLEALSSLIANFNEASAGFVFEGWLAALLQGRQEAERTEKGNLPIQDLIAFSQLKDGEAAVPVSLKLLSPKTKIEGSYTNLVDALFDEDQFDGRMVYVVARKLENHISIESFEINRGNFIEMFTLQGGGKKSLDPQGRQLKRKASGATLFELPPEILEKYPEANGDSIHLLNDIIEDDELRYELLQWTAGYSDITRRRKLANLEQNDEQIPPEEEGLEEEEINETLLMEAQTQWSLSVSQVEKLSAEGVFELSVLGELPSSREAIVEVAAMHMDTVRDKFKVLFAAFKLLNENINKYMTFDHRADAIKAGQRAITNTGTIQREIQENVAEEAKAPPEESGI